MDRLLGHLLRITLLVLPFIFLGCVSDPPIEDYVLADAAMTSARNSRADQYAPVYWQKAQSAYVTAESLFKDREFEAAIQQFRAAREYAERAENASRLLQFRSGEAL